MSKSISLSSHAETILNRALANGRFKSVDEVVSAALQLLDDEEQRISMLNNAIEEGVNSGWVSDFDAAAYLKYLKKAI